MRLFDANFAMGTPNLRVPDYAANADDVTRYMESYGIEQALVWHTAQLDGGPLTGNPMLTEVIRDNDRICSTWAILPPQTCEIDVTGIFDQMKANRIAALRAFPTEHKYLLRRSVFGHFFDEVTERGIPLLYSVNDLRDKWIELYDFMESYPLLTCIVCDVGIWGVDRFTWPLLERYPNLYLETSYLSLESSGLDTAVEKFGASRFVYGSGFPYRYPEAAKMDLIHADASSDEINQIAWQNMNNIMMRIAP